MATTLRVSFCFYCDAHLWCQVSRTLPLYFQRYRLFSISPLLGRVLLGSTVSGWMGWLGFFVFYWGKTVFGWFG